MHGVDEHGRPVLQKKLTRAKLSQWMANVEPCLVGMEACGGAHDWARLLQSYGHEVRLMSPRFVKPYVKSNKNDYLDAEAICEAVQKPNMRCIWTLPAEEADYSLRWRLIKSAFARAVETGERLSDRRLCKKERGIRQRRFWEHLIRDEDDFAMHADYIHYNPVKHGWVGRVADWPYSSFHRWVRSGIYPPDWGAAAVIRELDLG